MKKYMFLSSVTNTNGVISKEHGILIDRGTVAELDPESPNVKWLLESGTLELTGSEDPGNSILEENAEKSIQIIKSGTHSKEQLEELLAYEQKNKKRSTVIKAIKDQLEE
jgi:hypothetical protein